MQFIFSASICKPQHLSLSTLTLSLTLYLHFLCSGCSSKLDIIFAVDTSKSVGVGKRLDKVKDFLETTISQFNIGPDNNRFSIVQFGNKPQVAASFDDLFDMTMVKKKLNKMDIIKGRSKAFKGINAARRIINKQVYLYYQI